MAETVKSQCATNPGRNIPRDTILRLIGAAAGHCEKPSCPTGFLWHELVDGTAVRLAEVAHIVAASSSGPRGDSGFTGPQLVLFENLLLLCPNCHTIVDRAPAHFPLEMLREWKAEHEGRIAEMLGVGRYATRDAARLVIRRLLAENRAVWAIYGPESEDAWKPEVQEAWLREVAEVILPNNSRIEKLLEVNSHLLTDDEEITAAAFRAHVRAMEARHLLGVANPSAPRFPAEMHDILS